MRGLPSQLTECERMDERTQHWLVFVIGTPAGAEL